MSHSDKKLRLATTFDRLVPHAKNTGRNANRESQSVCACLHKSGDFGEFRLVQTFTSHITHILRCNDTSSSATDL